MRSSRGRRKVLSPWPRDSLPRVLIHIIYHIIYHIYYIYIYIYIYIYYYIYYYIQARSQKILLGSAFEEKVDLLILQYSPGAVENFIIVWCMLRAHIHEGLY